MTRKRVFSIHVTANTPRPSVMFIRCTRWGANTSTRNYFIDRHEWILPVIDRIKAVQPWHDVYDPPLYTAIKIEGRFNNGWAFDNLRPSEYAAAREKERQHSKELAAHEELLDRIYDEVLEKYGVDLRPDPDAADYDDWWDEEE